MLAAVISNLVIYYTDLFVMVVSVLEKNQALEVNLYI